jgi:hypothetical protein
MSSLVVSRSPFIVLPKIHQGATKNTPRWFKRIHKVVRHLFLHHAGYQKNASSSVVLISIQNIHHVGSKKIHQAVALISFLKIYHADLPTLTYPLFFSIVRTMTAAYSFLYFQKIHDASFLKRIHQARYASST